MLTDIEKSVFESTAQNEFDSVDKLQSYVRKIMDKYDRFEIEFAFLDKKDLDLKYPKGGCTIKKAPRKDINGINAWLDFNVQIG